MDTFKPLSAWAYIKKFRDKYNYHVIGEFEKIIIPSGVCFPDGQIEVKVKRSLSSGYQDYITNSSYLFKDNSENIKKIKKMIKLLRKHKKICEQLDDVYSSIEPINISNGFVKL